MIKFHDVSYGYASGTNVIRDFTMRFESGRIYGLLGKNGTGKSTLLYLMNGLLRPKSGVVTFRGKDTFRRLPSVLSEMYLVPEEFKLPATSLKNYVRTNSVFYPRFSDEQFNKSVDILEMDINQQLDKMSMGQKKKALMVFALATNSAVLSMDEPTNGLDIPSKRQFRRVVSQNMNDDRTLLISTHQVRDVDALLDHIVIIDKNKVLLDESVKDILGRLCFKEQSLTTPTDGALYVEPSIAGNSVIYPNDGTMECDLNLEVLFNATIQKK